MVELKTSFMSYQISHQIHVPSIKLFKKYYFGVGIFGIHGQIKQIGLPSYPQIINKCGKTFVVDEPGY